jgi:beta-glucanase (GH16 family)
MHTGTDQAATPSRRRRRRFVAASGALTVTLVAAGLAAVTTAGPATAGTTGARPAAVVTSGAAVVRTGSDIIINPHSWTQVWGDGFDTGVDPQKWGVIEGLVDNNLGNDQVFSSFDVSGSNGNLVINTEKRQYGSKAYTSGMVWTKGRFSFTYGKIEVRAKIPAMGLGVWPALWLQGNTNSAWPGPGGNEIDFAELWNSPSVVNQGLHYADTPNGTDLGQNQGCTGATGYNSPVNLSADYHLYSLVWEPGPTLTYYVDNRPTCQVSLTGNYFNTPMYIVMDTALGASWFGHPDATTPFPQQFDIDYVHVFQDQNLK